MEADGLSVEILGYAVDPKGQDAPEVTAVVRPADGQWEARGHFQVVAGQLICRRLEVGAADPGITSAFLRTIPVGTILTKVRSYLAQQADKWDTLAGTPADFDKSAKAIARSLRPGDLRRGPSGYPDDHYRRVAFAYLNLQAMGWGRGLLDELARQEDRPRETIRDWVRGARTRGYLSPSSKGRSGALPGPRLYEGADTEPEKEGK